MCLTRSLSKAIGPQCVNNSDLATAEKKRKKKSSF